MILNALRTDPTRTALIRRRFIAELLRRFRKLKAAVRDFIDTQDALALREKKLGAVTLLARAREFEFLSDPDKLKAFQDWLRQQIEVDVLSVPPGTPVDAPWLARFIESAFKRGQMNAYLSSKEAQLLEQEGVGQQTMERFLQTSFNQPETMNKIKLLATRAFEDLKGVTSTMSTQMNRILAQGMIDGSGPAEIASEMVDRIGSLTESRALAIARTETIAAHAEGQLDAFEELGVDQLGVMAEWVTAGDDRVCPECSDMEGKLFSVDEARGLIPLHPNCRCTWIPSGGN
jgi:SPP1 gp7 family putative phage head morphogenesis protein